MDDLSWRVLPVPPIYSFSKFEDFATNRRGFLVEYNGVIFSIFMGFLGKSIQVSKLDGLKMAWVRLESLGDKVLFLSPNKSLLVSAGLKGIGNRIYLPRNGSFPREDVRYDHMMEMETMLHAMCSLQIVVQGCIGCPKS
ncbi:hypothetical protein FRX31_019286 [Thalictrum thalictroides]|uniref:KIB1-4 beta-propeller domain-containing protein n=1 Tax=Thalictrum thalictroides TaxID=46969 RepID=A0A7J6W2E8_THATH|nr:hypothetical protein FRX31_019286 [Thalictrum thalictroides]